MDWIRRELEKYRSVSDSILLRDGRKVSLPQPTGTAQAQVYSHLMECARADMVGDPRPEPPRWYFVMRDAVDRGDAIRLFESSFNPGDERHGGGPYCWRCLYAEGKLVDISLAPSDVDNDVRPIPYGETEPISWDDVHAIYKEVG